MLVLSFPIGRLECSFHLSILFIIIRIMIRSAKIESFFEYTKSRLPFFPFFRGGVLAHSYVDIYIIIGIKPVFSPWKARLSVSRSYAFLRMRGGRGEICITR